jgi:membrane protein YdbS with pleckstrin-like domain
MPNDVKAYVSAAVAIVAIVLAYWSGSPVRPEFSHVVLATAAFMIVAMWIFPEAGGKRKAPRE